MSNWTAPGRWDPVLRIVAKGWSRVLGIILIVAGMLIGMALTKLFLLDTERELSWVAVAFVAVPSMVPFTVGCMMALPDVFLPVLYNVARWKRKQDNGGNR
jgi:hypothetical protein